MLSLIFLDNIGSCCSNAKDWVERVERRPLLRMHQSLYRWVQGPRRTRVAGRLLVSMVDVFVPDRYLGTLPHQVTSTVDWLNWERYRCGFDVRRGSAMGG